MPPPPSTTRTENIKVLYLHENLHLMEKAACLINSEWPRSMAARLRSLECKNQNEGFPVSILLVLQSNSTEEVIGHSKATLIYNKNGACYVESVVIEKNLRGQGYGKLIMEKTENYAREQGLECIYLTTQNEEKFYAKLGYEVCPPIMFCGSFSSSMQETVKRLGTCSETSLDSEFSGAENSNRRIPTHENAVSQQHPISQTASAQVLAKDSGNSAPRPPLPPAPPAPLLSSSLQDNCSITKVYMRKSLK